MEKRLKWWSFKTEAGVGFVQAHPSDKNKDVARVGHPKFIHWVGHPKFFPLGGAEARGETAEVWSFKTLA